MDFVIELPIRDGCGTVFLKERTSSMGDQIEVSTHDKTGKPNGSAWVLKSDLIRAVDMLKIDWPSEDTP